MSDNVLKATDIHKTPFSGGTRFSIRLGTGAHHRADLAQLDWSLCRFVEDREGQLHRIIDVPRVPSSVEPPDCRFALTEASPVLAPDSVDAALTGLTSGIEIEGATYRAARRGLTTRWEFSPGLRRLRGRTTLASMTHSVSPALAGYFLRLNADLRFARVGCVDTEIALQVVVPSDDRHWREVAENALGSLFDVLARQAAWWSKPSELLDEFFNFCGR